MVTAVLRVQESVTQGLSSVFRIKTSVTLRGASAYENISVGSVGANFGITDAAKLSTINLVASETGGIELGVIGTGTMVEDLQSVSIASSGSDINVGSVQAQNSGTFSVAMSSRQRTVFY